MLKAAWRAVSRHWGWSGFAAGVAAGVVLTLLASQILLPRLAGHGWEPGELVILSGKDESTGGQRDQLIGRWNAMGGGRPRARLEIVEGDTNRQRAEMVKRAQGDGTAVDIFNLDVILMEEFRRFKYIRQLDESKVTDRESFLPNPLRTCEDSEGKLWALPFNTDAGLLYYRDDLTGPIATPSSLPALRAAIAKVMSSTSSPAAGYAGQLAEYEGLTVNALEAIWAAGGQVVDGNGNVVIDSPQARDGLKWLALGLQSGVVPQIIHPSSLTFDERHTAEAFANGQVAFMRNWPVWHNWLKEKVKFTFSFSVAPIPGQSVLGGQNLAIAANSDQPRAAQALIDFLTGELSQQILFERGGLPATRAAVYGDADVLKSHPYAKQLLTAINAANRRPDTAHYATFSEVFAHGVRQALDNGGEPPPGFAADLADALRGIKH